MTRPSPTPRAAIIGGGMVGRVHRQSLATLGIELSGVLGSSPDRSATLAQDWGAAHAFASIEELAASNIDVVHVCGPTGTHAQQTRILLRAGKHVICEKPLATSTDEADELVALAEQAGVVAAVPFVYRYYSSVREIRDRIRSGDLGALRLIHGSYLQDWLLDPMASNWRVLSDQGGRSRAFADIGSHWCDLVEWITGDHFATLVAQLSITVLTRPAPDAASFSGPSTSAERIPVDTEDVATVLLRTSAGVPASLVTSQVSAGRKNRLWFELDAADGSAAFDHEIPEQAWFADQHGDVRLFARGSGRLHGTDRLPAGHPQGWDSAFTAFIADAYRAVSGRPAPDMPTFADGARSARIVDAVLTSSSTGAWTEIPS